MTCALILVTYNAQNWLSRCLNNVFNSTELPRIFIFDNASTDSTLKIISNFSQENIYLIKSDTNLGFGAANNICIRKAYDEGFKYFFLVNQDVYIQPNTIEILLKYFATPNKIGILSPIHLNGNGTRLDKNFSFQLGNVHDNEFLQDLYFNRLENTYFVPFVNAACWLITRKTVEIVGGFDPLFFHYGEDDNYCQRVVYHGLEIAITTQTSILHDRKEKSKGEFKKFKENYKKIHWLIKISDPNKSADEQYLQNRQKPGVAILKNFLRFRLININETITNLTFLKQKALLARKHKIINRSKGMAWL